MSGDELSLRAWAAEAEAAAGIARSLVGTPFVPDGLRVFSNPDERDPRKKVVDLEATVLTVTAVLLAGLEVGMGPMASLRSFTLIRGQVAMYALAARALLQQHGHEIVVKETNSSRAIVDARRAGSEDWQRATWDIERAKLAGLYPGHPDGNWRKNPKAMLVARASAEAARWIAADALIGLPVIAEEVLDAEVEPPAIEPASTQKPPPGDDEKPGKTTARKTAARRLALPAGPPPPLPDPVPPEPAPKARARLTKPQLTKIHTGLGKLGIKDRDEGLGLLAVWAGRDPTENPLGSSNELTPSEAAAVIDRLDAILSIAAKPPEPEGASDAKPD